MHTAPCFLKVYQFNNCMVDVALQEIQVEGTTHRPPKDIFDFIVYLIEHRGNTLGVDDLHSQDSENAEIGEYDLARMVMKARKILGDQGRGTLISYSKLEQGYRFEADVLEMEIDREAMM